MKKVSFSRFLRSLTAIVLALMLPFNAMASALVVNSEAQEVSVQPRAVEADPVITLPAALKAVPAQAFMGNDAAEEVILPEGILSIGEQAFADCTALVRAVIPESVNSIAQDAFEDLQEQLVIETVKDSYAWKWGVENGFIVLDPDMVFEAELNQTTTTLYVEGNLETTRVADVYAQYDLAEDQTIEWQIDRISGDDGVELSIRTEEWAEPQEAFIYAANVSAVGTSVWRVSAEAPDGESWQKLMTISVENTPENYPTCFIGPESIESVVGERVEIDLKEVMALDGVLPENGNLPTTAIGLRDLWENETVEHTEDTLAFTPDQVGEYRINLRLSHGNHQFAKEFCFIITSDRSVDFDHYFPTLFVGGNIPDIDVAMITVSGELAEGEEIAWHVEKLSGDGVEMYMVEDGEDSLTAYVVAGNVEDEGESLWLASADLPDGSHWEQEFTIDVIPLPEDIPELDVEYPMHAALNERFEFKPSERIRNLDAFPDTGNQPICGIAYSGEIWEDPTHESIDDGRNFGFAFTPSKPDRYGFSLYYYIGNHVVEHHGILVVGDGTTEREVLSKNLNHLLYLDSEEYTWMGNVMVERYHLLPDEEVEWSIELIDSSNDVPVVNIFLGDLFDETRGANFHMNELSGEAGTVTYRITARVGSSVFTYDYEVTVEETPDSLPTGLQAEQTYYEVEVGDTLDFLHSDVDFIGGEAPEGVDVQEEVWDCDLLEEQQEMEWIDGGISVNFVQDGRYQFKFVKIVGGIVYELPVQIVVGSGMSGDARMDTFQPVHTLYAGLDEVVYVFNADIQGYNLFEGESYDWTLEKISGDDLLDVYIDNEYDNWRGVNVHAEGCAESTGSMTYRLSVRSEGGLELSTEFTIEVAELPDNLPTELELPETFYELNVGDTLTLLYEDIGFADGEISEGTEVVREYWEAEELPNMEWLDEGVYAEFDTEGRYKVTAVAAIGNYRLTREIAIVVGSGLENAVLDVEQYLHTVYTDIPEENHAMMAQVFGYQLFEEESYTWTLEQISEGEAPLYTYINNEFDNWRGVNIHTLEYESTGSVTYRLTVTSEGGLELSTEFTIDVVDLPENLPTEMAMEQTLYELNVGDSLTLTMDMFDVANGEIPADAHVRKGFRDAEQLPNMEWLEDDGFTATFDENGRYQIWAVVEINNHVVWQPVIIIVGEGFEENAQIVEDHFFETQYVNMHGGSWVGDVHLEGYDLLHNERLEWKIERIDSNECDPGEVVIDFADGTWAGMHIHEFTGETGVTTWRVTAESSMGYSWSKEYDVEFVEMPENLPTDIAVPEEVVHLNVGETYVVKNSDFGIANGEVPEGADVYFDLMPGSVGEYGEFEWTEEGFEVTFREEGRYSYAVSATINGYEFFKDIFVIVGEGFEDNAQIVEDHFFETQYVNMHGVSWVGDVHLEGYDLLHNEWLEWKIERIDENEIDPGEVVIDHQSDDSQWIGMHIHEFTGETGVTTWRVTAESNLGYSWSKEYDIEFVEMPENLPTDIAVPAEVVHLNVGETYVVKNSDFGFANGEVPEGADVHFDLMSGSVEEYGEFYWTEEGFEVTFHEEGRYSYAVSATINGYEFFKDVYLVVGNAIPADAWVEYWGTERTVYANSEHFGIWAFDAYVHNYVRLPDEDFIWTLEQVSEGEPVAQVELSEEGDTWLGVWYNLLPTGEETGTVVYRLTLETSAGFTDSQDFTIHVVEMPEDFPSDITVPETEYRLEVGETFTFTENEVSLADGSVSESDWTTIHFDGLWNGIEQQESFRWMDQEEEGYGFEVTFNEDGGYAFEVHYWINNVLLVKEIVLIVGTGIPADAQLNAHQVLHTAYYGADYDAYVGDFSLGGYRLLPDEGYEWSLELIDAPEDNMPLELELGDEYDDGNGVSIHATAIDDGTGTVTYRLHLSTENGLELSTDITINVVECPDNLPTRVLVDEEDIYLDIGETYVFDQNTIGVAGGEIPEGTDAGPESWVGDELQDLPGFEWTENGFSVTFEENGRYRFDAAYRIGNYTITKEIRLHVGTGISDDACLRDGQNAYEAYAADGGNAWIGYVCLDNYQRFDDEDIEWTIERVDDNDCDPLYLYIDNTWDNQLGANIHAEGFTGETGSVSYRITAKTDGGFEDYCIFVLDVVEQPDNLPTLLHVPSEEMHFEVDDEFVLHNWDLTFSDDGVIPEGAALHYEYWDIYSVFHDQDVWENEENGGFTVHFHREGRYELTVAALINTYKLTRTFRVIVGDGVNGDEHMKLWHAVDPVYVGGDNVWLGNAFVHDYNVFENESIKWSIQQKNADEEPAAAPIIEETGYWDNTLGMNYHLEDVWAAGETTYVVTAELPTGQVLQEELTLHVQEMPEGLPTELETPDGFEISIGDELVFMLNEISFGEGYIPEDAAIVTDAWIDERLNETAEVNWVVTGDGDEGILIRPMEPGEFTITATKWVGNYCLYKEIPVNVVGNSDWKVAILTGSTAQGEEEYTAAYMAQAAYGEDHVIVETYPDNFVEAAETTTSQIVSFAEDPSVKAIIVEQSVPGTLDGFMQVAENRDDVLLISGMPQEDIGDMSRAADIVMLPDEAAQAGPIMDKCEEWGIDVFVHYSFPRHLALEGVAGRLNGIKAAAEDLGIQVVEVNMPDPATDGFDAMLGFIQANVPQQIEAFEGKRVAFFTTNCGAQAALQTAVLDEENAYYPSPCCPSPFHGFGESLGLELDLSDPEGALRKVANALNEHGAADRFSTGAIPVNMGIMEVAAKYAAAYAQGHVQSTNDEDFLNELFGETFDGAHISNNEFDNVYTIQLPLVDFSGEAGGKIAILTGSTAQGEEEYTAAYMAQGIYGEDYVIVETYPDNFVEAAETTTSQIVSFAEDPSVKAIIVQQSVPGTLDGFMQVAENRDDVLLISGMPQEDIGDMSRAADIVMLPDEAAQAGPIMDKCEEWGVDVFVHYSFPRHLALGTVAGRLNGIKAAAEELGIQVVEVNMPDPATDGFDAMFGFIQANVPQQMEAFEGKRVAFFTTNCGAQAALQTAVLDEENAYYPSPCCPSPFHGFGESLGLELDLSNPEGALRKVANALNEHGAAGRFSTGAIPVNMGIIEVAAKYAAAYAQGDVQSTNDEDFLNELFGETFDGAHISNNEFDNVYTIQLPLVDFSVEADGKIAILTGSTAQGEEEYTAAQMALERFGEERVITDTYPDNFGEAVETTIARIEAFADDPSVKAIVVQQSVPGTLEAFERVSENRDDVLLISGVPHEDIGDMSAVADIVMLSDEAGQAGPIMDKCEEWDIDVFVHYSFPRHLALDAVVGRLNGIKAAAEELGIQVVEVNMPDPSTDGFDAMLGFIQTDVPKQLEAFEGKRVAFFTTNCGAQAALQTAVLDEENAYYPSPCCPSPFHGFGESLGLELDLSDPEGALRAVANALNEHGAAGRFSTGAIPVNMCIVDIAAEYAKAYADGDAGRNDESLISDLFESRFGSAIINADENVYTIALSLVDFTDYVRTDDVIQLWVAESVQEFTEGKVHEFLAANEQYADLTIKVHAVGEGDAADRVLASDEEPVDMFVFAQDQLARLVAADRLSAVSAENTAVIAQENDQGSVNAVQIGDVTYAYPMTSDNGYFLYYDSSIVSNPSTLEGIIAACEAADRSFNMELTSGWYQPAFFFGAGCTLTYGYDSEGNINSCNVNYASENGVRALKAMIALAGSESYENISVAGDASNIGALVSGVWDANTVQEKLGGNYAAVKLPTADGFQMSGFGGFKMLGVLPQTDDHKMAACEDLAMYLTSEEVQTDRFYEVQWGPSNQQAQQNEAVQDNAALAALADQLQYCVPQGQYPEAYWGLAEAFGERLLAGEFDGMTDEDLLEVLTQFQQDVIALASGDQAIRLRWAMGTGTGAPADNEMVLEELNAMSRELIGVECDIEYYTESELMAAVAAGEEFDIYFTCDWFFNTNQAISTGMFLDISETVQTVAPRMYAGIDEKAWKLARHGGGLYAIPVMKDYAAMNYITYPADMADGLGFTIPARISSWSELTPFLQAWKATMPANEYPVLIGGAARGIESSFDFINRTALIGCVFGTSKVCTVFDDPAIMERYRTLGDWYSKGLINPDAPDITESSIDTSKPRIVMVQAWPGYDYSPSNGYNTEMTLYAGPNLNVGGVRGAMNALSSRLAEDPERRDAALKYLELCCTDQLFMDTLRYGVQGYHWNYVTEAQSEACAGAVLRTQAGSSYTPWAFSWPAFFETSIAVSADQVAGTAKAPNLNQYDLYYEAVENDGVVSALGSFKMDTSAWGEALAEMTAIKDEYYNDFASGARPIDEVYDEFMAKMNAAGLQEMIADAQAQLDDYLGK